MGAFAVCILVIVSTLPVSLPFILMNDATPALRVSNAIAVVKLFGAGFAYGRIVGRSPWLIGLSMVLLGGVLVSLTIALGG
jgi:VIT1/CCC1 family predicted Fe2+/Mn2+ transporter